MARLEYIQYEFFDASLNEREELVWAKQQRKSIDRLPQIFWDDGAGWSEANLWALDRASSKEVDPQTSKRTMKHLKRYADFLESRSIDWKHFPARREEQVLRKFRKHLIDEVDNRRLAGSTASNCMSAVIQFYRFADLHDFIGAQHPMWTDRPVAIHYHDSVGFKRSMMRLASDLGISNRKRIGATLEDGLLPLRAEHMHKLLAFTAEHEVRELHLMLATGFFTGARIGTVTTLSVTSLQTAREDPLTSGVYLLPVGPGTNVATKFSVAGELFVPETLLTDLKAYSLSTRRLLREAKAAPADKDLLFLTRTGRPYYVETVDRLVHAMRQRAVKAGLPFLERFRFHQSRATFGTWLLEILLQYGAKTEAIRIVRDAMLHKSEQTTLGYITFLENTRAKGRAAAAFNQAFTGLRNREWSRMDA
ncbi:hypothetical protein LMG28727_06217 [Paraburkholderia kirstenboschensis]|uniref:tyrosine-type recombinase/integrase n=2 Tax=Paraburkholderia kirstenboschensis TaxID=1245436 RepID=UPI00191A4180|nr:site-specific integrase [Paraburkholderia kirstenboschensis]CAD6556869.1 hypothetical protein LMG28727_06217 [Paraburkholderia kirstenboschensis]